MSIEHQEIEDIEITGVVETEWFTTLVQETTELDRVGLGAAMLSLRLHVDSDADRRTTQLTNLLRRLLRPTDRMGQSTSSTFSVLLAPLDSIAETSTHVHSITTAIANAGLTVSAGFAHRRLGETLLDTWARAEAQSDRAAYRLVNREGAQLGE